MLYFAYGMNTNNAQMSTTAVRLGVARLPDWAWEMLQYANVYPDPNSDCTGILWDIDSAVLAGLDIREGYPTFYTRELVDVVHGGVVKQAWVYTMTAENREYLRDSTPSQHYVNSVVEGYATDGVLITDWYK